MLFCPPSSVPEKTSPGQKPTLTLLFLPPPPSSQILAEGAAGNRARSQSDGASVSGCGRIVGQAGEFYMGGSDWLERKWLLLQAAGRAAIDTSQRPRRSVKHTPLSDFTPIRAQSSDGSLLNGCVRE